VEVQTSGAVAAPAASVTKRRGRRLIALGAAAVLVLLLGAGAAVANVALTEQYSANRAVTDYFAAQQRGDVNGMMANATFLRGDGSYAQFFNARAVGAMMSIPANTSVRDVKVRSTRLVDSSTASVTVALTWNGKQLVRDYNVRKDSSRVHYLFYPSWRVDVPSESMQIKLPNQAGLVTVDGIAVPDASQNAAQTVQVIQGFHRVAMIGTGLYDSFSVDVDDSDSAEGATVKGTLKPTVVAAAAAAIKDAFNKCDAGKYDDCINHTYTAPNNGNIYYFDFPGYGEIDYTKYVWSLAGDPTADVKLVVAPEVGKVTASGSCATTLTVDDSRKYAFKGDYTATLTWGGSDFGADVTGACDRDKA
jgi:hypothetical protein